MQYKILFLFTFFMAFGQIVIGQTVNENDTSKLPEIVYSNANPKYEIAEITITGADKQAVGAFAAEVRAVKPPEPYKGFGIRYVGEKIIRKAGKAAAAGAKK